MREKTFNEDRVKSVRVPKITLQSLVYHYIIIIYSLVTRSDVFPFNCDTSYRVCHSLSVAPGHCRRGIACSRRMSLFPYLSGDREDQGGEGQGEPGPPRVVLQRGDGAPQHEAGGARDFKSLFSFALRLLCARRFDVCLALRGLPGCVAFACVCLGSHCFRVFVWPVSQQLVPPSPAEVLESLLRPLDSRLAAVSAFAQEPEPKGKGKGKGKEAAGPAAKKSKGVGGGKK